MKKHRCNVNEAKLEESKVRVLFSWAQKDKHGVAKPLPCEECSCWYARLDTHLKGKSHNYNDETVTTTVRHMRSKYWCEVTGKIKENVSSSSGNNVKPLDYVPVNSRVIAANEKKEWGIENDDFHLTYEIGDDLLDAFREDIACKKGKEQYGMNYKNHVDYIWTVVDPSKTVLPTCGLGNPTLVEDVYHKPTFSQVGKGGNEASSLRVRFTALKAYIAFLRRRKIYGGMTRAQMTSLLEYVEIWSSDFTDMVAQRKTDIRRIKKKRLMTPSHMIKYGRSNHVKVLVKQ